MEHANRSRKVPGSPSGIGPTLLIGLVLLPTTGCANFAGTTAASFLRTIRENPDPNQRYIAYQKLSSPNCYDDEGQKAKAVEILTAKLQAGEEPVATRAVICRTLGTLGHPSGREAVLNAISDPEPIVRAEACGALGALGLPEDATVLSRVMTVDTSEDCRIAAIEALGRMKTADPRVRLVLVSNLEHDDPAIRYASLKSLRAITGQDRGVDVAAWRDLIEPTTALAPGEATTR